MFILFIDVYKIIYNFFLFILFIDVYKIIWIVVIGLQVGFHSAMKHENSVSNVVWLSLSCENLRASYIVFLFVNNKNTNFIKENKHVVSASIVCWKPWQSLWKFSSRWKPSTTSDLLLNSPERSPWFLPRYEGRETCFIS